MPSYPSSDLRGVLNPAAEGERFRLARLAPTSPCAALVENYWSVRWALAEGDSYLSETLPFPSVNVVFEAGTANINGIFTRRWSRTLRGAGRVFGVKFLPGAFAPLWDRPMRELTDRVVPFAQLFGAEARAIEREVDALAEDSDRARAFEAFLAPRLPPPDPERARTAEIAALALATPGLARVEQLALTAGLSVRGLQRLFQRYLGVSPKWLLCRFRIQDAAQRVAQGGAIDWSALAHELGYFDQAHFATDFKAQLGKTPGEYAAFTRSARG